ncbi:MAG: butyryl-CoA:acetate CoA-transferase [Clostridia bacterium]|nr:butyryl-CoA:acetate CoA-transferase [Clostridia bacterium]
MDYRSEYKSKLRTPEEAVKIVKSGDWIDYNTGTIFPMLCDAALAERRDELSDVKIRGMLIFGPIQTAECDPEQEHFTYSSWHCSNYERTLCDKGLAFYQPMIFRNLNWYYKSFLEVNVAFVCATPMDEHGYFNFSVGAGVVKAVLDVADVIVIEVNENLPKVYGGYGESIHISEIDMVVEGEHPPVLSVPAKSPTPTDIRIAENVIPYIMDGATIQLGIGGVPDALGQMIAQSDLKDLGMHTEFCTDAFLHLYNAGKITNKKKAIDRDKCVFGVAQGTRALYDWVDKNPAVACYPIEYVNNPETIAKLNNFISLNSCVSVDLYGQVCSESAGTRHISGTGGQVDFLTGAAMSNGGKAFICTASTFTDKSGKVHSRIVPYFSGDIVTSPRSQAYYIATEHAVVNLAGRSTWERAELLISAAAPEFRDDLIKAAREQRIWRKSNKR